MEQQTFKGDNYVRYTGDTYDMLNQESFAWDHSQSRNNQLNTVALPTQTESEYKDYT